jgi:hypothetical protein
MLTHYARSLVVFYGVFDRKGEYRLLMSFLILLAQSTKRENSAQITGNPISRMLRTECAPPAQDVDLGSILLPV